MKDQCVVISPGGGVYEAINNGDAVCECRYACLTAPKIVKAVVSVDGTVLDTVFAGNGGSHSWWQPAGGGLLKHPLKIGQTLRIEFSDECAFRIDWY